MPGQPLADVLVLVGGVVIKDHMHGLVCRNVVFQPIEETDELLMPVALHVAPEDRVVGQFKLPPSMWGELMLGPNLLHREDRDAGGFGHGASRPVRYFVGRRLQRHRHHALDSGPVRRCNAGRAGLVAEKTMQIELGPAARRAASTGRTHDRTRQSCINITKIHAKCESSSHDEVGEWLGGLWICSEKQCKAVRLKLIPL